MRILILCFSLFLFACSSTPSKTFLLLQPPQQTSAIEITHPVKKLNVQLSEYLNRPTLAIANQQGEILFSEQYQWAERLDIALADILQQRINQQFLHQNSKQKYRLQVFIQRFHSIKNSDTELAANQMILKGEYLLFSDQGDLLEQAGFALQQSQKIEDYQDINLAMQDLIKQLAELISQQIIKLG